MIVADPSNNDKKCEYGGSNRVFVLRGGNANEENCKAACMSDAKCVGFSGIWNKWCIGCSTDLTDNHSGAIAYKFDGSLLP